MPFAELERDRMGVKVHAGVDVGECVCGVVVGMEMMGWGWGGGGGHGARWTCSYARFICPPLVEVYQHKN